MTSAAKSLREILAGDQAAEFAGLCATRAGRAQRAVAAGEWDHAAETAELLEHSAAALRSAAQLAQEARR